MIIKYKLNDQEYDFKALPEMNKQEALSYIPKEAEILSNEFDPKDPKDPKDNSSENANPNSQN